AIHDSQLVAAGITTVFDALSVGDVNPASVRLKQLTPTIEAVCQAQRGGWLAADHRIHMSFELSFEDGFAIAEEHLGNPLVGLVSLMDHSPGQRQFTDPEKLDQYLAGKYGLSPDAVRALVQEIQRKQELYGDANRAALARLARERGLPIASHDDATAEHVAEAARDGVTLAEFPTTVEAARAAHERGMRVVAGAPNLMLGGSHSGNVSTAELGAAELVDILSSDYVPLSLLHGVFRLAAETGRPLHRAARTATLHAAQAVGMNDRGALAPGLRADLIAVREAGGVPRLQSVWVEGRRVV
ncbi:MAG: alpha-D-ribose 1-methylphosphonate 5-triphosphate diphosphatase, partial [SAR324 cluster bacterium]|nr:alpha-D-ribose 1-methylphosphonate 5-triphosphate diphosphatase [SAR324 cluster bacterium]